MYSIARAFIIVFVTVVVGLTVNTDFISKI